MKMLSLPSKLGLIALVMIMSCKGAPETARETTVVDKDTSPFDSTFSHELVPVESNDNVMVNLNSGNGQALDNNIIIL